MSDLRDMLAIVAADPRGFVASAAVLLFCGAVGLAWFIVAAVAGS